MNIYFFTTLLLIALSHCQNNVSNVSNKTQINNSNANNTSSLDDTIPSPASPPEFIINEIDPKFDKTSEDKKLCNISKTTCQELANAIFDNALNCTSFLQCQNKTISRSCIRSTCQGCTDFLQNVTSSQNKSGSQNISAENSSSLIRCICVVCNETEVYSNNTKITKTYKNISFPNFPTLTPFQIVEKALNKTLNESILKSIEIYKNLECKDDRVATIFGIKPNDTNYQKVCKLLVNDFFGDYLSFKCNSLLCNNNGNCLNKEIMDNKLKPICLCNDSFNGKRCIFKEKEYQIGLNLTLAFGNWLNKIKENKVNLNETQYIDLLNSLSNLVKFSPNIDEENIVRIRIIMKSLFDYILNQGNNMKINSSTMVKSRIIYLVKLLLDETDTFVGINPIDLILLIAERNLTNEKFGKQDIQIDLTKNLNLTLGGGKDNQRNLDTVLLNKNRFDLNPSSPVLFIPINVSKALNNSDILLKIAFIRDPKVLLKIDDKLIQSQLLKIYAYDTKQNTKLKYPNINETLDIILPWSSVPFKLAKNNYSDSCKVLRFNGDIWVPATNCSIKNETNQFNVSIACSEFSLIGVACETSHLELTSETLIPEKNKSIAVKSSAVRNCISFLFFLSIIALLF